MWQDVEFLNVNLAVQKVKTQTCRVKPVLPAHFFN